MIAVEVISNLYSAGILSENDKESIESVSGLNAQAKRLLKCLVRKDNRHKTLESFVTALEVTEQIHVAAVCQYSCK